MKKRNIVHSALSLSLTAQHCAFPWLPAAEHRRRQTVLPLRSPLPRPLRYSPLQRNKPLRRCR